MTTNSKPTPGVTDYTLGPWTAVGNRVYATAASGKDTMTTIEVAVATRADPRARAKIDANARLIAAAPDLLAACKALLAASDRTMPRDWHVPLPVSTAKAAIARAEGKP